MLIGRLSQMSPPPCLYDTVIQSYVQLKSGFYGATLGRSCPPGVQLLPHFEVWSYRACQPLQMCQISHFCEIHSLSYEASKFFAMLSLCVFLGRYFAPGANIVPPIAYKSHSTPFPIRPHVLTPHSWLCDKNCGRSSAPKKKWNLEMADNTNVALPYMASTINYTDLCQCSIKQACIISSLRLYLVSRDQICCS